MTKRGLTKDEILSLLDEDSGIDHSDADDDYIPSSDEGEPDEEPMTSDSDDDHIDETDTESIVPSTSYQLSRSGEEMWHSEPLTSATGRKKICNVLTEKMGSSRYAQRNAIDITCAFHLFFS